MPSPTAKSGLGNSWTSMHCHDDHQWSLLQDAVELALRIGRSTAVAVANRPEDDPQMQRKLWLAIAKHLICTASDANAPVSALPAWQHLPWLVSGRQKLDHVHDQPPCLHARLQSNVMRCPKPVSASVAAASCGCHTSASAETTC